MCNWMYKIPNLNRQHNFIFEESSKLLTEKHHKSFAGPLCAYTEEASCHSSCPLEAGEAPFQPVAHGIVQQLLPKLMGEISVNYSHFWVCKEKHFATHDVHLSCR